MLITDHLKEQRGDAPAHERHADRSIHLFDGRVVEEDGSKKGERELEESGFDIAH